MNGTEIRVLTTYIWLGGFSPKPDVVKDSEGHRAGLDLPVGWKL